MRAEQDQQALMLRIADLEASQKAQAAESEANKMQALAQQCEQALARVSELEKQQKQPEGTGTQKAAFEGSQHPGTETELEDSSDEEDSIVTPDGKRAP